MELFEGAHVRQYDNVGKDDFAAIVQEQQPAVFRGYAAAWPAVQAALRSDEALVEYLGPFLNEKPVAALVGPPEIGGRFFYEDNLRALNFQRFVTPLRPFLNRLIKDRGHPRPACMAVQSVNVPEVLPGFETQNQVPMLGAAIQPRAWFGNRIKVATHWDLMENLGVVVAGRRRFVLFPPDQIANLYVGPFEPTPAGTPVSLVDVEAPDLKLFPRFEQAAAVAQSVTLEPGDAIYIPFQWWHAVSSLGGVNLFVNYWWNDSRKEGGRPYDALMLALLALRPLPPHQRAAWRELFEYYVFERSGPAAEHLPEHARGILGDLTPDELAASHESFRRMFSGKPQ
jgi:hypothetical protein